MARIRRPLGTVSPNTVAHASNATTATETPNQQQPEKPITKTSKKRKSTDTTSTSTDETSTTPVPAPKKQRKSTTTTSSSSSASAAAGTGTEKTADDVLDVSDMVYYDSEAGEPIHDCIQDPMPVFDTCDTIRRKIRALLYPPATKANANLNKPRITQAAFLRAIVKATYGPDSDKTIQSATLSSFMTKKGALAGNTSTVYYAAYVFFEKLRVKQGKPKSDDREIMEEIWGYKGGVDTKTVSGNVRFIGSARSKGYAYDKYGCPRMIY